MKNKIKFQNSISKDINYQDNYNKIMANISNHSLVFKFSLILTCFIVFISAIFFSFKKDFSSSKSDFLNFKTSNYLSEEMITKAKENTPQSLLLKEYTLEYMKELSDAVAIVSIVSVDYANTDLDIIVGNTYGKMVVNNVIWGNIPNDKLLKYIKSGGIMTLAEYEKNQPENAKEKNQQLQEESGLNPQDYYVNMHFPNDPIIEEGKVYLAYLKYQPKYDSYEIIGLGNGFRELNIEKTNTITNEPILLDNITIKNNNTGEFESLTEYINLLRNIV